MDLSTIKKNIDSGVIRTTAEFQRDMMLMFINASMYNNVDHDVHKMAVEMYNDVMMHIEVPVSVTSQRQSTKNLTKIDPLPSVILSALGITPPPLCRRLQ